jgi:hypothetical protein
VGSAARKLRGTWSTPLGAAFYPHPHPLDTLGHALTEEPVIFRLGTGNPLHPDGPANRGEVLRSGWIFNEIEL